MSSGPVRSGPWGLTRVCASSLSLFLFLLFLPFSSFLLPPPLLLPPTFFFYFVHPVFYSPSLFLPPVSRSLQLFNNVLSFPVLKVCVTHHYTGVLYLFVIPSLHPPPPHTHRVWCDSPGTVWYGQDGNFCHRYLGANRYLKTELPSTCAGTNQRTSTANTEGTWTNPLFFSAPISCSSLPSSLFLSSSVLPSSVC